LAHRESGHPGDLAGQCQHLVETAVRWLFDFELIEWVDEGPPWRVLVFIAVVLIPAFFAARKIF
jgi:hypothetical protein